ncbi:unnamed protein product [Vicia faba]|uniref:Uncharacterized protein n=1 Tax=Vicia faba TaxID=3906 RepID=A0AAV1AXG8_VICFA|nr:unnamed protein product [Vicia faba]
MLSACDLFSPKYNTDAKRTMENVKQEISELRKEVTNLKAGMDHSTVLVEILVAAQVSPSKKEEAMIKVFIDCHSRMLVLKFKSSTCRRVNTIDGHFEF